MPVLVCGLQEDEIIPVDLAALLEEIGAFVLQMEGYPPESEISIVLVDNNYIRELNLAYRGLDSPTDVLSFPLCDSACDDALSAPEAWDENDETGMLWPGDEKTLNEPGEDNILGDVVISLEKAQEQALNFGHSLRREVAFLAVHGILHLVGYDHLNEAAEKEMTAKQDYVMERFDCRR